MDRVRRVKFLTVIWGRRYVEEFAAVSLPSYLAPGNLPHLASETDLEVLILTSRQSVAAFEDCPPFGRLREICPVRFIFIDDLITSGNYGVTLTLAYARGIQDSGPRQTDTHFVFMNSDFVLADGGMRTLTRLFGQGHGCIMAASLRGRAETILPVLRKAVGKGGTELSIGPRDMVALALANLHPTVIGKTVTQSFMTCDTHNQIYWQVDKSTLLGRSHLIFMLSIRPEVEMAPVNSYCDYGFVPELVPSGRFHLVGDSDDLFLLELQPTGQEKNSLRLGTTSPKAMASELSRWTTPQHRRFARFDTVFHAAAPPAGLERFSAEATAFVKALHARMGEPVSHANHHYWELGLQAWCSLRTPSAALPPELRGSSCAAPAAAEPAQGRVRTAFSRLGRGLRRLYLGAVNYVRSKSGTMPDVAVWHPLWLDARLIRAWVRQAAPAPGRRVLLLHDGSDRLVQVLASRIGADVGAPGRDLAGEGGGCHAIFLHTAAGDFHGLARRIEAALRALAPDGELAVFMHCGNIGPDQIDFAAELIRRVEDVLPGGWLEYHIEARFVGGRVKRALWGFEGWCKRRLWPSRPSALPLFCLAALGWVCVSGAIAVNNLRSMRKNQCPLHATGVLLTFRRRASR